MSDRQIRVMVVDDHPGIRALIKDLLVGAVNLTVIGEAENGVQAIELAQTLKPDLILLDIELPLLRGDIAMREIRETHPDVKVLGISSHSDAGYIGSMLENGASGYITKDEVPDLLIKAIYGLFADGNSLWMSAEAERSLTRASDEPQTLTKREAEILRLLLEGRSEHDIATALLMDAGQLGRFLHVLMHKFQATEPAELKEVARRLLPPSPPPS